MLAQRLSASLNRLNIWKPHITFMILAIPMALIIGAGEGWGSIFPLLMQQYDYKSTQLQLVFGTIIFAFSISIFILGRVINRVGERALLLIGSIAYGASYFLGGYCIDNYPVLLLAVAVQGSAMGGVYIALLQLCVRLFPNRFGSASGIMLAGYALGACLTAFIVERKRSEGLDASVVVNELSIIYGLTLLLLAILICTIYRNLSPTKHVDFSAYDIGDKYTIVLALATMVTGLSGYMILSNVGLIARSINLSLNFVPVIVAAFVSGNAIGRFMWGWIADYIGAHRAIILSFICQLLLLPTLVFSMTNRTMLTAVMFLQGICFGAFVVLYAARSKEYYGPLRFGSIYSVVSLAFGGAGFLGPAIGGWSYTRSKDFVFAILIVEILLIVGFSVYMFYSCTIAGNGIHPKEHSRETNIAGVK